MGAIQNVVGAIQIVVGAIQGKANAGVALLQLRLRFVEDGKSAMICRAGKIGWARLTETTNCSEY